MHIPYFQTKALAEKNMRDLLAQREQAEKHVRHLHTEDILTVSAFIHSIGVYVFVWDLKALLLLLLLYWCLCISEVV